MTLLLKMILCLLLSFSTDALQYKNDLPSNSAETNGDSVVKLRKLLNISDLELVSIKKWQGYNEPVHTGITALFLVVPFTILYYDELFRSLIAPVKYWISPISLGIYYINYEKSHKRTAFLLKNIENDVAPLSKFLKSTARVMQLLHPESRKKKEEKSQALAYIDALQEENKDLYKFIVDVLSAGARKYSDDKAMMKQQLGGDQKVRILVLYSFFTIIDESDEKFSNLLDTKASLNIAALDFWHKSFHSYQALTDLCAEKLKDNLVYLEWPQDKLIQKYAQEKALKASFILLLVDEESGK